jgi:hypothetical protein
MSHKMWLRMGGSAILGLALSMSSAVAQDHGHGHDKEDRDDNDHGHGHGGGHEKDKDHDRHAYSDHDRDEMRGWYRKHYQHLPPGLAKRDRLPPGLERQLVVRGTLPPGLRAKIVVCPRDLEVHLPPPPPDCEHVLIGGHVVLLNRRTFVVVDLFHLDIG